MLYPKYTQNPQDKQFNKRLDSILTHKYWGLPIFLLILFVMFQATFTLGGYPMGWIEDGVHFLSSYLNDTMTDSPLKSLLIDGVIGGVGGVIVFLPNILILYTFITLIEQSGYIDRAAKMMDGTMHLMGLHGRSFIPLIMGFGCNVPAIMATSSIHNRTDRLITILVNPFISCSARLPIYILMVGTFFPEHSGLAFMGIYVLGIVLAVITAHILRRFMFNGDEKDSVSPMRPYRMPSVKSIASQTWSKAVEYIRKMGGLILIASIAIWFLSYYPHPDGVQNTQNQDSYIARIGKAAAPAFEPLGFGWQTTVALISGTAAKEVIVSTLGVLYAEGNHENAVLSQRLQSIDPQTGKANFSPASAMSFMVFVLLYFPCIAALAAIKHRSGSWRWAAFSLVYNTSLAWVAAFITYRLALLWL